MELLLGIAFFILVLRFIRGSLELPLVWGLGVAALVTLVVYPAVVAFFQSVVCTLTSSPLWIPLLVLAASVAGFGAGFVWRSRNPSNPFD